MGYLGGLIDFNEIKLFLIKFTSEHKILFPAFTYEFGGPYHARNDWEKKIPLADENGIYFYANKGNEVLLIGRGEFAKGGGIGNRVCSHLGKAHKNEAIMFPNHEWKDDPGVLLEIQKTIESADFYIYTMKVDPSHYSQMMEVMAQSYCRIVGGCLPPLNKRIG